VTVRDLLTHRVGFPDPDYLWDNSGLEFTDMVRRLRLVPVNSSFRSRFEYNNVGYSLAGDITGKAAGTTWQALMQTWIYRPLGMTESYPDARSMRAAGVTDVSAPHGIVRDTVRVLPVGAEIVDPVAPAGAAFSTATDMGKWLRFLLDSGRVTGGGKRLVSAQNFAQLLRPQQLLTSVAYPATEMTHPHFQAYGFGWFLRDYRGEFVAYHTGSIEGRSAIVGLIPDRRLGVVIFTNLDHSELRHALMYTVFDRYLGPSNPAHDWSAEMRALYRGLADSAAARQRAVEGKRITGTRPTLALDKYAGTYADSLYGTATVGFRDGKLTLQVGTATGQLEHWQYDVFRATWPDPFWDPAYVAFEIALDGTVGAVRFVDGGSYRRVR
jgi:CubicO group peptidase (beta-lactamase class C family)